MHDLKKFGSENTINRTTCLDFDKQKVKDQSKTVKNNLKNDKNIAVSKFKNQAENADEFLMSPMKSIITCGSPKKKFEPIEELEQENSMIYKRSSNNQESKITPTSRNNDTGSNDISPMSNNQVLEQAHVFEKQSSFGIKSNRKNKTIEENKINNIKSSSNIESDENILDEFKNDLKNSLMSAQKSNRFSDRLLKLVKEFDKSSNIAYWEFEDSITGFRKLLHHMRSFIIDIVKEELDKRGFSKDQNDNSIAESWLQNNNPKDIENYNSQTPVIKRSVEKLYFENYNIVQKMSPSLQIRKLSNLISMNSKMNKDSPGTQKQNEKFDRFFFNKSPYIQSSISDKNLTMNKGDLSQQVLDDTFINNNVTLPISQKKKNDYQLTALKFANSEIPRHASLAQSFETSSVRKWTSSMRNIKFPEDFTI